MKHTTSLLLMLVLLLGCSAPSHAQDPPATVLQLSEADVEHLTIRESPPRCFAYSVSTKSFACFSNRFSNEYGFEALTGVDWVSPTQTETLVTTDTNTTQRAAALNHDQPVVDVAVINERLERDQHEDNLSKPIAIQSNDWIQLSTRVEARLVSADSRMRLRVRCNKREVTVTSAKEGRSTIKAWYQESTTHKAGIIAVKYVESGEGQLNFEFRYAHLDQERLCPIKP